MFRLVGVLLLLLSIPESWGAPMGHAAWDVRDGLPVNGVSDLLIGPDGYLWVSTFDGLVRFDGVSFRAVAGGARWPSRRVSELLATPDGAVWAWLEQGRLVKIEPSTDQIEVFEGEALQAAPDGTIWTTVNGAVRHIGATGARPFDPPALRGQSVLELKLDREGGAWCRTETSLIYLPPSGEAAQILSIDALGLLSPPKLVADDEGGMWVATVSGVLRLPEQPGETPQILAIAPEDWRGGLRAVSSTADGEVWISTEQNLYRLRDGRLTPVIPNSQGRPPLRFRRVGPDGHTWIANRQVVLRDGEVVFRTEPGDGIVAIEVDPEGTLWIGTSRSGLHQVQPSLFASVGLGEGLRSDNVYAMAETRGGLWIGGSDTFLSRWASGRMEWFGPDSGMQEDISAIHEGSDGTLWVGAREDGLFRGEGPSYESFRRVDTLGRVGVAAVVPRPDGSLLVGTTGGLWRGTSGVWERMDTRWSLPSSMVRAIAEGPDDTLWLGTNGGGVVRVRGDESLRWGAAQGVSDLVRAVLPDGHLDGRGAWIGTEDQGMIYLDEHGPTSRRLGPEQGLPDTVVHTLLDDGRGYVWGNTNKGLFRVERAALETFVMTGTLPAVERFTERDGLPNREGNGGNHHSGLRLSDGTLALANQRGVVLVDPTRVTRSSPSLRLRIEELRANDQVFSASGPVTLAPDQRSLEVRYTALRFRSPERVRFQHRLKGLQEDWIDAGEERLARYAALPPGEYQFELRATDADGQEGVATPVLVTVEPLFTETLTFRVLVVLASLGVIVGAAGARVGALRRRELELTRMVDQQTAQLKADNLALEASRSLVKAQAERLSELDRIKTRYFSNLSHELRTPLTLIIGPLDDVLSGRHGGLPGAARRPLELARRNSHHLIGVVNQLLDVVKIDAGQMLLRTERIDVAAVLVTVSEDLRPLAERRGLQFEVARPDDPVPVQLDPREAGKIFANLVTNAIKYTPPEGAVHIRVEVDGGTARVVVQDTGPGIPLALQARIFERFYMAGNTASDLQPGTGLGLALARELAELHGWTLRVESTPGKGSTFIVDMPLSPGMPVGRPVDPLPPRELSARPGPVGLERPGSETPGLETPGLEKPGLETGTLEAPEPEADTTTVLVIDDNADIRAWIHDHLRARYRVLEAADGEEGLRVARHRRPDLIVTDRMMPGLDGIGLLRAIRADPELDWMPVVMLSARGSVDAQVEGLGRGADVYLSKPFSPDVLAAQIEGLILQRQRLRVRFAASVEAPPPDEDLLSADARYMLKVQSAIRDKLADPSFGVQELADAIAQDRSHMYRRVQALTGQSPSDLLRTTRLEAAATLLRARTGTVSEVAYAVGFNSVAHFSTAFRKQFGVSPSGWQRAPDEVGAGG